jgi:hypothetical protein
MVLNSFCIRRSIDPQFNFRELLPEGKPDGIAVSIRISWSFNKAVLAPQLLVTGVLGLRWLHGEATF